MSRTKPAPPPSPAKGLFATFLVIGGIAAALWLLYDPWLKPYFGKRGDAALVQEKDRVVVEKPVESTSPSQAPSVPAAPPRSTTSSVAPAPVPPKSELEVALEETYPMPEILPLLTIVDHWRNVPSNAYPAEVTAKETIPFQLVVEGRPIGSSNVAPGTPLKPVRLVGDQLFVASLGNADMSTQIAVDKTDFKERIEARYRDFVETKRKEVEEKRERVRQIVAADPAKLALLTGTPAPEDASSTATDGSDPRFAPVKASLKAGELPSATLEEARTFRWNGTEQVSGKHAGTYETVTVRFDIDTIFGRFPVDGKALLRNGRVHAWIDPFTEDPI